MASNQDYVKLLREVPLFAAVPDASLEKVTALASDVTHEAGHVIVRQGTGRAHALHVIVSGKASVSADGRRVATLGPEPLQQFHELELACR